MEKDQDFNFRFQKQSFVYKSQIDENVQKELNNYDSLKDRRSIVSSRDSIDSQNRKFLLK